MANLPVVRSLTIFYIFQSVQILLSTPALSGAAASRSVTGSASTIAGQLRRDEVHSDASIQPLARAPADGTRNGPGYINANDFWGIRDLLLIGYSAFALHPSSTLLVGRVQEAAADLADMLPTMHPVPACRTQLEEVLSGTEMNDKMKVLAVAATCWSCLPARFTTSSFNDPFTEEMIEHRGEAVHGKMPELLDTSVLGACRGSNWHRACSYWVSLDHMAVRADQFSLSREFLHATVFLLNSGATMCQGCTAHAQTLHRPVLSEQFLHAAQNTPCTGPQCSQAEEHNKLLVKCLQHKKPAGKCVTLSAEVRAVRAYRSFLSKTWKNPMASAVLVAFHNLVTYTIDRSWFPPGYGKMFCFTDLSPQNDKGEKALRKLARKWKVSGKKEPSAALVPGIGPKADWLKCRMYFTRGSRATPS
mmetsp:Transcript_42926/g.118722  ORF Transcript_42926/g.118722 Transcript_42926/m.118722 type:complete len:418 (-) Transcript_42926:299-1552(-)